ncbi:hypothetical protein N7491_010864 [Penicillium cf. griseofulvum]|uniref:Cytochrome P450 n=1 Tax=Penicillium cf. griseofulvum TaxID=2972120 RepID=A0A9W9N0L5_9EURO|nr:hypothetical protein N7472_001187 [Penicillium cf. griseofulvum]KAJ5422419.1 hypothetical protein N7491_010864 [Penicillium cf. griseofulvum]
MAWTLVATIIPLLLFYLWKKAIYYRTKQYALFPQLPPSLLWGHLSTLGKLSKTNRPNIHIDEHLRTIYNRLGKPALFVVDLRPLTPPMCVICDHDVAEQVSQSSKLFQYSLPKSDISRWYTDIIGSLSIVLARDEEWKSLRKQFNPGFAHKHLISLMPCILEKTQIFLTKLDNYASTGEEFQLDELCTNLTFDIIGAVTMDIDLDAQLGEENQSAIVRLFRKLGTTYRDSNSVWKFLLPLQRKLISHQLGARIKERIKEKFGGQSTSQRPSRSVLALSLASTHELTPKVLDRTCDQLKSFLFAGHDTTSILLQWTFYELSRTPHVLRSVCRELDEIFGPDSHPTHVREQILEHGENVLQRMTYTSAVIKEILRLYPPAGTSRVSAPNTGFNVRLPNGQDICLDGLMLYNCESIIHRDQAVYGDKSDQFIPQRWLETGSTIPASAWRAFERGPRNCIGQELANIEALVILACATRRYGWEKVGLGAAKRDESGAPIEKENGQYEAQSELYNTLEITAKPVDGMRMRVKIAGA